MQKHSRILAKTITWRITATLTTILLVLIFTKKLDTALTVGSIEFFAKMIIYYLHEKIWDKSKWGIIIKNK